MNVRITGRRVARHTAIIIVAALVVGGARAQTVPAVPTAPAMTNNVLLVGWDGAHRDHVRKLLTAGRLPNLQNLTSNGALVDLTVTSGATDTKAGWTQILTGYRPRTSGVANNRHFRDVPAGYSLFERLKARFGTNGVAAVAVIGKKQHCGEIDPPYRRELGKADDEADPGPDLQPDGAKANRGQVVTEKGRKYLVFDGSPYYTMHLSCDAWVFGLMQDVKVGDRALALLDRYGRQPFLFFVHFAEVDHQGHRCGEASPEYDEAIVSGDRQLGRLVARLKEMGVYERTLIYVTADHGFDLKARQHKNAPLVFLGTNDRAVCRNGTRADVAPTILDRLGVDLAAIRPPLDGASLARPAPAPEAAPPALPPRGAPGRRPPR